MNDRPMVDATELAKALLPALLPPPVIDAQELARNLLPEILPAIQQETRKVLEDAAWMETLKRKICLRADEVEALYGITVRTLENWRFQGRGPQFVKDGRVIVYRQKDLLSYLELHSNRTRDQRAKETDAR